ncbi:ferredoxin--NADP reductase [Gimesia fumaroli]|uniref:ferredoxin--NADP(+) reductase n=1 Tax=Gimesia fumaroli TaxID=2527976 RepID=A0A518IBE6_9PLAN|nr:ferredoxin--NADP reductase [Gimesia fumaroli]QDV50382.1 Ferredoxin--NADP reductase [Gimesia fumaroli]
MNPSNPPPGQSTPQIEELVTKHYNATIQELRKPHDHLMIVRVKPDAEVPSFSGGQYTTLGLGSWEPRVDGGPLAELPKPKLIRRAYSISCPMVDTQGILLANDQIDYLEFYITLVLRPDSDDPPLTPRLFSLKVGDRLHLGKKPVGTYTLKPIQPEDNVIFAGTGTGEAPHNSMSVELLKRGHTGKIVSMTCVRYKGDLGYLDQQDQLQKQFPNYRYAAFTTREPENVDQSHPHYVGKQYLQDIIHPEKFQEQFGWTPNPEQTHVFLCGNPSMIGLPEKDEQGTLVFPEPKGMVELLTEQGYQLSTAKSPGNIHFEKYW